MMKQKKEKQSVSRSFLDRTDSFFDRHDNIWFWILFGVTLLVALLLYDPRVSPGGDDSGYIVAAHDLLKEFKFPGFQGPLYPMVLSLVDAIFGMSVPAFKIFSMCAVLACIFFIFRAFRKRIPATLLFITLLFTSVNSHVLYFASQTYSEAFYMFMQSLLPLVFFTCFIDREKTGGTTVTLIFDIKRHLLLAIVLLGIVLARNIGYAVFISVAVYFICYRQWKNLGLSVLCFAALMLFYQLLVSLAWHGSGVHGSAQVASFLYKDLYHPEYGRETLGGFFDRFWQNSNEYISRFFMSALGLRDSINADGYSSGVKPVLTIITYLLAFTGIGFAYKRNRYLFFTGVLTGVFLVATFFIVHTFWKQERMIIPAFPLMAMISFAAFYYLLRLEKFRSYQFLLLIPLVILFFTTLSDTSQAIKEARKIKNEYSGLTPDWLHYAQASAWAGENLPEEALVACRKPSISTIYGKGKRFYGIYRIASGNLDNFVKHWEQENKEYAVFPGEVPDNLYTFLIQYYEARILIGNKYYLAVNYTDETKKTIEQHWPDTKIFTSPSELKPLIGEAQNKTSIYYADSLLVPLRNSKVTHLLTASLRMNPYVKNGQTVNTVERVALFIQEKYPHMFSLVKQFGDQDDEPANIVQINWDMIENKP